MKGDAAGPHPDPAGHHGPDPQAGPAGVRRHPGLAVGTEGGAEAGLAKTLDLAAVALAAEQVGGAQRCLDRAVEYAKTRIQFGRPIGSFQAIKHKCADMLLRGGVGQVGRLLRRLGGGRGLRRAAGGGQPGQVLLLGGLLPRRRREHPDPRGIGFTWEHDAHLYFKRAKSSELLLGDPTYHRELLAQRIGI